MYAKVVHGGPPVLNEVVGFDLMLGDWVAPYGRGGHKDILFKKSFSGTSNNDYNSKLVVSFPNPTDGIQEFGLSMPNNQGSYLRSPHEAPAEGYSPMLVRENSATPGKSAQFDYDEKKNYFFRVRTVLDENGKIKSALYGKIYGDFMQFTYYLNPTPNDRNVEFDPKQNLLKGLKSFERVDVP